MEVLKGQAKVIRSSSSRSASDEMTSVPTMIALAGLTAFTMSAAYQLKTSQTEPTLEVASIEARSDAELIADLRRDNDELEKKLAPLRTQLAKVKVTPTVVATAAPAAEETTTGDRLPASIGFENKVNEPAASSQGAQ